MEEATDSSNSSVSGYNAGNTPKPQNVHSSVVSGFRINWGLGIHLSWITPLTTKNRKECIE